MGMANSYRTSQYIRDLNCMHSPSTRHASVQFYYRNHQSADWQKVGW